MKKFDIGRKENHFFHYKLCSFPLSGGTLITKCGHVFCKNCIRKKLAANPNCPHCHVFLETDLFSYVVCSRQGKSSKILFTIYCSIT
jgi:hypothetical protein